MKQLLLFSLLGGLCLLPTHAQDAAPAPGEALIGTVEIRGINNVMRQAGSVMQMMGQEMPLEDMQAMFGAMVMSQEGIDLDGTVRIFIPDTELNPAAMQEPPIVVSFPIKGDAFLKSLALSMNKKAGEKADEAFFSPKPGGAAQLGGLPSLSSMPFHTKTVGDTVLLGPSLKFVRKVVPHMKKLAVRKNVPGTVAIDLNVPKLVDAMEDGVKEMQAMQRQMQLQHQKQMLELLKEEGEDVTELEKQIEKLEKGGAADKNPTDAIFTLLKQLEVLQFGLDADKKMFSVFTLAEAASGSTLAKSVADMKPPSEAYRKSVPTDALFSYVGRVAHMDDMMTGYFSWLGDLMAMGELAGEPGAPDPETFQKMMKDIVKVFDGQLTGEVMSSIVFKDGKMVQAGAMGVRDTDKMVKDMQAFYDNMKEMDLGDGGKMGFKKIGTRKVGGKEVTAYEMEVEMADLPPGAPNPAMFMNSQVEMGSNDGNVLFASKGAAYDALNGALAGSGGGTLFEKSGAFAKNFPTLKRPPVSMYEIDILAYLNMAVSMMAPEQAKKMPAKGASLTGWSNRLGEKYLHVDRIRFEDVLKIVQAGQQMVQIQMEQMQKQFELPPDNEF